MITDIATRSNVDQNQYREWLELADNSFSTSSSWFDLNVRPEVEKNLRQFQSLHPQGSKYLSNDYKNRSKLFRPKSRAVLRKSEAVCAGAFFSSEDVVAIRPMNERDPFNLMAVDFFKELLQIRLTRPFPVGIPWFMTLVGAFQETNVCGVVVSKQEWHVDEKKGIDRPRIILRPVENVRIDSAADWTDPVNSSPFLIDMIPMYVGDIKKRMSDSTPEDERWFPLSEADIRSAVSNSFDSTRQAREGQGRTDSKETSNAITDYTIAWVHDNIISRDGEDYVYQTLGTRYMLSEPKPLAEVYAMGIRPYAMGISILEAHRVYSTAKIALGRDTQKEANEISNERRDNVKQMLNPRWKALKGKQVDLRSLTRNVPSSVTLLTNLTDAEMIETPDVTGESFAEQDRVNGDFDEVMGNFSSGSVQNNRRLNETVGGMDLLSMDADIVGEYDQKVFVETWVEPVLRQMIKLERRHETNDEVLRMAAMAAGIKEEDISEGLIDLLLNQEVLLNVNVGIGSTNPQKQLDRFVTVTKSALELLGDRVAGKLKVDEVIKELYGKAGYKDGARFFDLSEKQADPMEALQAAVVQAKVELTQAQTKKTLEDAEQSKAAKVVKMVEALYSAMQTAQTAVTVPGVAPTADAIAKSAGYVDQDRAPIYPDQQGVVEAAPVPEVRENTSPMFPPQPIGPGEGMMKGIETQDNDGVNE
jgi:hypothetical protein